MFTKILSIISITSLFILLTACSGGGGGGGGGTTLAAKSVSGTITGASGVTVTLTLASAGTTSTTTTDANGNYSFTNLADGSYIVTPTSNTYMFTPVSVITSMSGSGVGLQNLIPTSNSAPTYCLSGMVNGPAMQNVMITLNGANTGETLTDANGSYSFCGLLSGNYTVTPSLAGYTFTTSSVITIGTANSTSIVITSAVAPTGGSIVFVPITPLPSATIGKAYSNTVVSSTTGGTNTYHYQSDTFANGTTPLGMYVDLNGILTGTPSVAGTYNFGVCAVDTAGASSCKATSLIVYPSLVVSLAGTGSGTVSPSPAGTSCGTNCYSGFANGTAVTLTATPSTSSTFTGWSGGGCSGTGSCVVTMNTTNQVVTATFTSQGVTGTWSGSFVWPGANYNGCTSQTINESISLSQSGSSITGSVGTASFSGTISGNNITMTQYSTIFGLGTPQTWTWNGANSIQAVVGYGCYDLNTLAVQQHGYYTVTLTRQ